jgi:hypothetical protein
MWSQTYRNHFIMAFQASMRQHEFGEPRQTLAGVAETGAIRLLSGITTVRQRLKQWISLCSRALSGLINDSRFASGSQIPRPSIFVLSVFRQHLICFHFEWLLVLLPRVG